METSHKAPPRERPKPVKLTEAAAARLRQIMADADGKYLGVRVGVTNGGCAGMSYTMNYAEDTKPAGGSDGRPGHQDLHRSQGDPVPDRHRDWISRPEKLGARFAFNNPNQTAACGCGEFVSITPAKAD